MAVFPTGPKRAGRSVFGNAVRPSCRPPKCLASSHNPLSWVGRLTVATWLWRERRCPLVSSGTGSGQGEGGPSTTAKGTSRAPFRPGKPLPSRSSSRPESPACLVLSDVAVLQAHVGTASLAPHNPSSIAPLRLSLSRCGAGSGCQGSGGNSTPERLNDGRAIAFGEPEGDRA